jgi:hypothetical protein
MKKIFFFLVAAMMSGVVFAGGTIAMPTHLFVACQNGSKVTVINCKTNETTKLDGYMKDLGVDKNGNVYVLVCDSQYGWDDYTVYKNSSIYMSLKSGDNMYYSSMAMCVKEDVVVVAGTQVKKFNNKGYESRLFGYKNNVLAYETEWERKSLKRDQFHGYSKIVGSGSKTKTEAIMGQNESGCPDGFHLSVGYHVDAVDYCDGVIYSTGWGEREYSETPLGFSKQYLVRRCPRVWKNGHNYVEQYENQTGAAWNIAVFKVAGKEYIFTSGHHRNKPCAWEHSTVQLNDSGNYPCIVSEATFQVDVVNNQPVFCRVFLIKQGSKYRERGIYVQGNKVIQEWGNTSTNYMLDETNKVVAGNNSYYRIMTTSGGIEVWGARYFEKKDNKYQYKRFGTVTNLPSDFVVAGSKLAVYE